MGGGGGGGGGVVDDPMVFGFLLCCGFNPVKIK